MYQWLLDQQITKLYSLHPMVPKQIKGTPKEYRSTSGHWFISGPSIIFALGSHEFQYFFGPQLWNDKKLENEHFKKYPYEQLTCDELEKFIEIIETAKLFGKRIGQYSNIEPPISPFKLGFKTRLIKLCEKSISSRILRPSSNLGGTTLIWLFDKSICVMI